MRRCFLPCLFLILLGSTARAENWPQWRGPNNDGVSTEKNLPAEFGPTKNLAWEFKLPGMGGSTPAVWGDRLFLTCEDGNDLVVLCISTAGKQLWKQKFSAGSKLWRGDEGNQASPSPSTDGKHVWVFAGTGDCACFDVDGKEVWKFNVQERYGQFRIQHGMHITPLLHGDRLYLSLLHSNGWTIVALDKGTGKEVWKVKRDSDATAECKESYASPVLWQNGKDSYLVIHGCDYATAHKLDDGSEIWRLGGLNPKDRYNATLRFVTTPLCTPDLIIVPSAKQGPVVAIKPDAKGSIMPGSPSEQWRRPRNTPDVPSPLIKDGLVYLCGESGTLYVLDAKTGEEKYQERMAGGKYRASPVYADGKIYCTGRDIGTITVVKAGPKFELLAKNKLPDQLAASPAISNGRIYVRGYQTLYAFSEGGK